MEKKYKIITGRFEKGTEEQKMLFTNMLGTNVQYKFDLYFHWYNIIHELGHCLLDMFGIKMDNVEEEFWVNRFAVAYWNKAGDGSRLTELKEMLEKTTSAMPNPVPQGQNYLDYFKTIWKSMQEMDEQQVVMLYGYFQFSCVLEAMKCENNLSDLLQLVGIHVIHNEKIERYQGAVSAENAIMVLNTCIDNLQSMGVNGLDVELEFTDNPGQHCANKIR